MIGASTERFGAIFGADGALAVAVPLVTVAVGVARDVEPMAPPTLAIPGRCEQAIDQPLIRGRTIVVDERRDLLRRRREPGQAKVTRSINVHRSHACAGVRPLDGRYRLSFSRLLVGRHIF
jgi:hypothetical protein